MVRAFGYVHRVLVETASGSLEDECFGNLHEKWRCCELWASSLRRLSRILPFICLFGGGGGSYNIDVVSCADCGGTEIQNWADLSSRQEMAFLSHVNHQLEVYRGTFKQALALSAPLLRPFRLINGSKITLYVLNTVLRHFKIRSGCLTGRSYDTFYIISRRVNLLHLNFKTVTFSRPYRHHYIWKCVANTPASLLLRKLMTRNFLIAK